MLTDEINRLHDGTYELKYVLLIYVAKLGRIEERLLMFCVYTRLLFSNPVCTPVIVGVRPIPYVLTYPNFTYEPD